MTDLYTIDLMRVSLPDLWVECIPTQQRAYNLVAALNWRKVSSWRPSTTSTEEACDQLNWWG